MQKRRQSSRIPAGAWAAVATVLTWSLGAAPASADWPQWRGLNRNGVSQETNLLEQWPEGGPPLAWRAAGIGAGMGRGFSRGRPRLH